MSWINTTRKAALRTSPALFLLSLAACGSHANLSDNFLNKTEPVIDQSELEYRQDRFEEVAAQDRFRECRDEGLTMDRAARASASVGQYHRAARILETCVAEAGVADAVDPDEQMRVMALSIQDHAKAGNVSQARKSLKSFERRFEGRDLYFADGTSFIESMRMVLGMADPSDAGIFSTANVNTTLKSEVRRQHYWATN